MLAALVAKSVINKLNMLAQKVIITLNLKSGQTLYVHTYLLYSLAGL